jgi:hypothetical protein
MCAPRATGRPAHVCTKAARHVGDAGCASHVSGSTRNSTQLLAILRFLPAPHLCKNPVHGKYSPNRLPWPWPHFPRQAKNCPSGTLSRAQLLAFSEALLDQASLEACTFGFSALDVLHMTFAKHGGAEECITPERSTSPLFRATGMVITTIDLP